MKSKRLIRPEPFFFMFFPVKVEMKGPHDYSSPADWPLMMVCSITDVKSVFQIWYYGFGGYSGG